MKFKDLTDDIYDIRYGDWSKKIYKENLIIEKKSLTSLEGSPKEILGLFNCQKNKLTSLKGSPQKIQGNFDCSDNNLSSLEYCTKKIGETFCCRNNPKLKNVKQQIIENQIKSKYYITDEGNFSFKEISVEFIKYGLKLKMDLKLNLIKKEEDILKNKISFKKNILKETQKKNLDFGLGI